MGQRSDGRIVMLRVDGRRPGYSSGMTNFELAQTMARLGVVTASHARRGRLLDDGVRRRAPQPSVRQRRRAARLRGAPRHVLRRVRPATELSFSPNGDGAGDRQRLEYKIVKPSTVTAT